MIFIDPISAVARTTIGPLWRTLPGDRIPSNLKLGRATNFAAISFVSRGHRSQRPKVFGLPQLCAPTGCGAQRISIRKNLLRLGHAKKRPFGYDRVRSHILIRFPAQLQSPGNSSPQLPLYAEAILAPRMLR